MDRTSQAVRPSGRPAGFQRRWRHLLFLHWEVPMDALGARAPEAGSTSTPSRARPTSVWCLSRCSTSRRAGRRASPGSPTSTSSMSGPMFTSAARTRRSGSSASRPRARSPSSPRAPDGICPTTAPRWSSTSARRRSAMPRAASGPARSPPSFNAAIESAIPCPTRFRGRSNTSSPSAICSSPKAEMGRSRSDRSIITLMFSAKRTSTSSSNRW